MTLWRICFLAHRFFFFFFWIFIWKPKFLVHGFHKTIWIISSTICYCSCDFEYSHIFTAFIFAITALKLFYQFFPLRCYRLCIFQICVIIDRNLHNFLYNFFYSFLFMRVWIFVVASSIISFSFMFQQLCRFFIILQSLIVFRYFSTEYDFLWDVYSRIWKGEVLMNK